MGYLYIFSEIRKLTYSKLMFIPEYFYERTLFCMNDKNNRVVIVIYVQYKTNLIV